MARPDHWVCPDAYGGVYLRDTLENRSFELGVERRLLNFVAADHEFEMFRERAILREPDLGEGLVSCVCHHKNLGRGIVAVVIQATSFQVCVRSCLNVDVEGDLRHEESSLAYDR